MLVRVHAFESGDFDRQEAGSVGAHIPGRLFAEESREDGVSVAAALELDAGSEGVPEVVSEPLVEVGRNFKVDAVIRHRNRGRLIK